MARSFWRGAISFGLVNIPVALYSAESSEELSFNQLDRRDLSPIGYKRVNKKTEKEVPWEQIVRGYQYKPGRYVVLTDQDFKRANVETTQTIEIVGFVQADQISPMYYERPYYVEPSKAGRKAYALLRETLRSTGMIGIATLVVRTRQYMAALIERDGVLVIEILRWEHEIADPKGLEVPDEKKTPVNKKEVEMAVRLVKGMAEEWKPKKFKDTYTADLMALIKKRIAAGKTAEIDESEPARSKRGGEVIDLMPLLKKSLEKKGGGAAEDRPRVKTSAARSANAPRSGKLARISRAARTYRTAHSRRRQAR